MLLLETEIDGKKGYFGTMQKGLRSFGYSLCGNWEYDRGMFDSVLWREGPETIYLRLPFHVVQGELDREDALIEFEKPFLIKHIVNFGLDKDENSLMSATGFNQFQKPVDPDGEINNKHLWQATGEHHISKILKRIHLEVS